MKKNNGLWFYLSETHNLNLLGSEIDDILALARQEIELPDRDEITKYVDQEYHESVACDQDAPDLYALGVEVGITWALNKVRNPYPRKM
jgi:hypothetical protein